MTIAADFGERCVVEPALKRAEIRDEERVALEFLGIVDELSGVPLQRSDGEVVEPERDVAAAGRGGGFGRNQRRRGEGRGGRKESATRGFAEWQAPVAS